MSHPCCMRCYAVQQGFPNDSDNEPQCRMCKNLERLSSQHLSLEGHRTPPLEETQAFILFIFLMPQETQEV